MADALYAMLPATACIFADTGGNDNYSKAPEKATYVIRGSISGLSCVRGRLTMTAHRHRALDVVFGEDTSDETLMDIHPERFVDLLRDSMTTEAWVSLSPEASAVGLIQKSFG